MLRRFSIAAMAVLIVAAVANADQWKIDKAHSTVGFSVRHLVVTKINGKFNDFSGSVDFDAENLESGAVKVTIQMVSIDTDNQDRDNHLRSPDFFAVEKFPEMTFKSKKVVKGKDSHFKIIGDLTIRDVTREVTLDCEFNGTVTGPMGKTRAGFSASTEINRQDFGVSWSKMLETGGLVVSDKVTINLEIELVKAG